MTKLRVTIQDLDRLTPEARTKLIEWWIPRPMDLVMNMRYINNPKLLEEYEHRDVRISVNTLKNTIGMDEEYIKKAYVPLFSISRIIDLLNAKTVEIDGKKKEFSGMYYNRKTKEWAVLFGESESQFKAERLCDALWNALTFILNND